MASTNDDIMTAMIDQETESGVDFSFDILKYVNGEEEGCMLWNDNDNIKYTQQETVLDPALITGIVLSPTPTTATSNPNPFIILKDSSSDVSVSTTTSTSNGVKQFEETSTSIFFQETHNPWGEPR
ncbi:unnamed protein product [Orchesella dallaii]|uniref:Uncharacterized protein n=1 Tax=Orchesella dallaii TaxID=48710 RepID=A0ABP1PV94_9HEXA